MSQRLRVRALKNALDELLSRGYTRVNHNGGFILPSEFEKALEAIGIEYWTKGEVDHKLYELMESAN